MYWLNEPWGGFVVRRQPAMCRVEVAFSSDKDDLGELLWDKNKSTTKSPNVEWEPSAVKLFLLEQLPKTVWEADTLPTFKSRLKTLLSDKAYSFGWLRLTLDQPLVMLQYRLWQQGDFHNMLSIFFPVSPSSSLLPSPLTCFAFLNHRCLLLTCHLTRIFLPFSPNRCPWYPLQWSSCWCHYYYY